MPLDREIRADFDDNSIVVYQAYPKAIAEPALIAGKFVSPFSFGRMTWIKPSYLWLMERSNWARKSGQESILAVRIAREGWEEALSVGVLTDAEPTVYGSFAEWDTLFRTAKVHVQWDPERSLRGNSLPYGSLQVGISRHLIQKYVDEWILSISDYTARTHKIAALARSGQAGQARALLPPERIYPLSPILKQWIGAR